MDLTSQEQLCRKDTLKQFETYLENTTTILNDFVDKLGWSLDETPVDNVLVKCPLNSEHRILPSKLDIHCQKCILKQNGYDSTHSFYPSYNCSTSLSNTMQINEITQMQILKAAYEESNFTLNIKNEPRKVSQSIERYCCDFTSDERRILYDNAVKNTKLSNHDNINNEFTMGLDIFNKTEKPKTELDILHEKRDLKRRRVAYRGKRVHTDRKSYVEVLREVIEGLTNNLSQDNTSINIENANNITESGSNNRFIYKYEGNQNYNGNPYTRWTNIKVEESELFKYYEEKNNSSHRRVNTSEIQNLKERINNKKLRKSRSNSRETRRSTIEYKSKRSKRSRSRSKSKEIKYTKFRRSRTPLKFKETKTRRNNTRSKSKEILHRKSRSRSRAVESKYKESKSEPLESKHKKSKISRSRSNSLNSKHKKSKKHKSHSKSKECNSRKESSRSPINNYKLLLSDEKNNIIKSKSSNSHKKKKKHKSKSKKK